MNEQIIAERYSILNESIESIDYAINELGRNADHFKSEIGKLRDVRQSMIEQFAQTQDALEDLDILYGCDDGNYEYDYLDEMEVEYERIS